MKMGVLFDVDGCKRNFLNQGHSFFDLSSAVMRQNNAQTFKIAVPRLELCVTFCLDIFSHFSALS